MQCVDEFSGNKAVWVEWTTKRGRMRIRYSGDESWESLWEQAWESAIKNGYTPPRWWQLWRRGDSKPNSYYPSNIRRRA